MLDQKDRHILNSLEADAKTTLNKLSKELGISITAVRRRVARLEKSGIIEGYKAVVNKRLLGIRTAIVCISTKEGSYLDVMMALKNYRHVRKATPAHGDGNILAVIEGQSSKEVQDAIARIKGIAGIKKANMLIIEEALA
ncbi:MAG: Lrp/AsnC family transcriptional regulator [Candidatus Anstonellales archaeon]